MRVNTPNGVIEIFPAPDETATQTLDEATQSRFIQLRWNLWIDRLSSKFYFGHPLNQQYPLILPGEFADPKPLIRLQPGQTTVWTMQIMKLGPWAPKEAEDDDGESGAVDGAGGGGALQSPREHGAELADGGDAEVGEDPGEPPPDPAV